eukprot:Hpha_TRINITY_DN4857_c0_g1::TRINITY_DN4857_c0_g1_i1::g.20286::m.20286/K11437/PRMT6; type I protein arginine methyltransferase
MSGESDQWYFDSYSSLPMQEVMLRDSVRTAAYKRAIFANRKLIEGAVVVDVGCGTGILSIFCAQAGAREVYAVEASGAASLAEKVVAENGVQDVVRVVRGSVEELIEKGGLLDAQGQPVKADVMVSEWMGFALTVETMLPSVLRARDAWLRPGGAMMPERAILFAAPFTDSEPEFWLDVHGVKMRCLQHIQKPRGDGPDGIFDSIPAGAVWDRDRPAVLCDWDLSSLAPDAATGPLSVKWTGDGKGRRFDGVCLWFDVLFPGDEKLSTAPGEPDTHWRQTLLFVQSKERNELSGPLRVTVNVAPHPTNKRYLSCSLEWNEGAETIKEKKFGMVG